MACPTSCTYNEIREPLTVAECASLTAGNPIGSYATVCDYLKSLPARLWDLTNHLENLGNYGTLAVNDESKCKSDDEPTAASLTSEFALFADSIACYLCGGLGNTAHFHDEGGTDFNQSATEPVNIPAPLKAGDTVIEDFDDYLVFWTYDGTAWVKNFTHNKADANSTFETYNTTIPVTYTTPNTIPTDPEAGDTLIEQFTDGLVYWTYDGTNWVKNFTDSKDIHSYHILQTGNAPSLTPAFPVPITTAQAGDTAIVKWDDGEAKYTFDGTTWILDWFKADTSGVTNIQDANGNVTVLNGNGNIPSETLDVINGGIELNNISTIYNTGGNSGFTALNNGTFILATTTDLVLTPIHQNMDMNIYLDPTSYITYSIGTTTNYVFTTQYSTNSGATWNNWEVGNNINITPGGPSTGDYYLTANDYIANISTPTTIRFRIIVTVTLWNGGNILSSLIRARGLGVVGGNI